jgi:hypothetical protein
MRASTTFHATSKATILKSILLFSAIYLVAMGTVLKVVLRFCLSGEGKLTFCCDAR